MPTTPIALQALFPTRPITARHSAGLVIAGSLIVAVCAQINVQLPFALVPITGQTFGVLLVGALLGSRLGALALLAYLAEGIAFLPVFAGGAAGPMHLAGPTGGYLAGFVPAAWLAGWLVEKGWDRTPWLATAAMVLGTALIFLCGLTWLAMYVPPEALLTAGLTPYLPGAAIKIGLAALLLPSLRTLIKTRD